MAKKKRLERRSVLKAGVALTTLAALPSALAKPKKPAPAKPVRRDDDPQLSLEKLAYLRLAFGPRLKDLEKWSNLGPTPEKRMGAWLETQLKPKAIDDAFCEQKIAHEGLSTLSKSMEKLWADHVVAPDQMKQEEKQTEKKAEKQAANSEAAAPKAKAKDEGELRRQPASETEIATWLRAVYSERQLLEVMASFWHNHFNVFAWDNRIGATFVHYDRDVIRKHTFGNFREMLEDVAKSPTMLLYLDNGINQSGNPNENYARELFELHTLGAENYLGTRDRESVAVSEGVPVGYVDGDVYEAARCFTGWRLDTGGNSKNTGTFEYFDQWHDRFQKIVLGKRLKEYQPPLKDGRDVLDLLADHPGTARFVSRKLCRQFVADEPTDRLVAKVAKIFHATRKAPDQIAQVIKFIALSEDFKASSGQKMARPFEATVSFLRATGADFTPTDQFLKNFEPTGRRLFSWRTPDGFPDRGAKWLGTNTIFERWRLMNHCLLGTFEGVHIDPGLIAPELIAGGAGDPAPFIPHLENKFLFRELSMKSRGALLEFLKKNEKRPRRFLFATSMAFMAPEMQWA